MRVHENIQDYRIMALSIRFLARLLATDDRHLAPLFSQLHKNYVGILHFILDNAFNEEALMRFSCIEALEQIVTYDLGAKWYLINFSCNLFNKLLFNECMKLIKGSSNQIKAIKSLQNVLMILVLMYVNFIIFNCVLN